MRKLWIILAAIGVYGILCSYGPHVDLPEGRAGIAIVGFMVLLPIGGFVWAIRIFHRWHRGFHARMQQGLKP